MRFVNLKEIISDPEIKEFFDENTLINIMSKSFVLESEVSITYESFCAITSMYPGILNWISIDPKKINSETQVVKSSFLCLG